LAVARQITYQRAAPCGYPHHASAPHITIKPHHASARHNTIKPHHTSAPHYAGHPHHTSARSQHAALCSDYGNPKKIPVDKCAHLQ
jgi:hypothetical protein